MREYEPDYIDPLKHTHVEGRRGHVVSYDTYGARCSEPFCEINQRRADITGDQNEQAE